MDDRDLLPWPKGDYAIVDDRDKRIIAVHLIRSGLRDGAIIIDYEHRRWQLTGLTIVCLDADSEV